jgi:hypothetical protein
MGLISAKMYSSSDIWHSSQDTGLKSTVVLPAPDPEVALLTYTVC